MRTVKSPELDSGSVLAYCCEIDQDLVFDKDMHPQMMGQCLLHEVMHAIFPGGCVDDQVEEIVVDALSAGMYAFLIDNGFMEHPFD